MRVVIDCEKGGGAGQGEEGGKEGEEEAVGCGVGKGRGEEGEEEGGGAGRDGVELGFDRGVLVGLDYAGGEVAVA